GAGAPTRSTRITSAPMSASSIPASGIGPSAASSTTRVPCSGPSGIWFPSVVGGLPSAQGGAAEQVLAHVQDLDLAGPLGNRRLAGIPEVPLHRRLLHQTGTAMDLQCERRRLPRRFAAVVLRHRALVPAGES